MANRHDDARAINDGACNPIAIANAIKRGIQEVRAENTAALQRGTPSQQTNERDDPALRLMVLQLAHLFNVARILDGTDYNAMLDACDPPAPCAAVNES